MVQQSEGDLFERLPQTIVLGGVQFQCVPGIGEHERVQDQALLIGECLGLENIHSEARYRASQRGKQRRPVLRDDGSAMHAPGHIDLHRHAARPTQFVELGVAADVGRECECEDSATENRG